MNRVAVTGWGLVCALGNPVPECWGRLAAGESCHCALRDPGSPPYKFQNGAEARSFNPSNHFSEKDLVMLERFAQFATVAAREAVLQSGLSFKGELADRSAVITGSSVGGQFSEEEGYQRLYKDGNPRVSIDYPTHDGECGCQSNFARIWHYRTGIHHRHGLFLFEPRVGAGLLDGSWGAGNDGNRGRQRGCVRGGPAACLGGDARGFTRHLPAVLGRSEKGSRWARGAACWCWRAGSMLKLGRGDLGEIVGFGMTSDAFHVTQPTVDGPTKAMQWALQDASIGPEQVGYVNAHGTGTVANDVTESEAIRRVFSRQTDSLLVSSTKSMHGHTLGAAGAVEAIATLLALKHGLVPPTANFTSADPACALDVVPNTARLADVETAISNTFAFGGLNATLVMKRV